jgi:DNA mismatch repair ATPase MutS
MRDGTLLGYLSEHNATAFGKRMLKRWVVGPLKDCAKIDARLDAVEDFLNNDKIREDLGKALR